MEDYLALNRIWHEFIHKPETIHTVDAAKITGIPISRVTKNLVCETDRGEHIVLILPGDRQADLRAAAKELEVRNLRLVRFEEAEKFSGYPPGGTPSIGHKTKMRVVVDKRLLAFETIYCGGGSRDRLLKLKISDVVVLNDAVIASISV